MCVAEIIASGDRVDYLYKNRVSPAAAAAGRIPLDEMDSFDQQEEEVEDIFVKLVRLFPRFCEFELTDTTLDA